MEIDFYVKHLRSKIWNEKFEYAKKKQLGQFFTSDELSNRILMKLDSMNPEIFQSPSQKFIDPTGCGIGNLLFEALIRKLQNDIPFEVALENIYGVDIDPDAIEICRERLICKQENLRHIVTKNIICADCTKIKNWSFNGTDPYKSNQDLHNEKFFDFE